MLSRLFVAGGVERGEGCIRVVLQTGGCARCAMRFIPISHSTAYESTEEVNFQKKTWWEEKKKKRT